VPQDRKRHQFASSVLASLLAALVIAGLTYLVGKLVSDALLASFIAALVGFGATLAAIRLRVVNPIELIGARYLDAQTGIAKVYRSLDEAAPALVQASHTARRIDLFLHIGRREFGITDSLFYQPLKTRLADSSSDLEVRVLHIDKDSPYLSEARAQELGKRHDKWARDVDYVRAQILDCAAGEQSLRLLTHKEPFVWRLFFFDDEVYVSAYLHRTRNDEHAPVFNIKQGMEGTNSLYSAFKRYYDHLWHLASIEQGSTH